MKVVIVETSQKFVSSSTKHTEQMSICVTMKYIPTYPEVTDDPVPVLAAVEEDLAARVCEHGGLVVDHGLPVLSVIHVLEGEVAHVLAGTRGWS